MADPRFFSRAGPFSLGRLAELTGSQLSDPAIAGKEVSDVAPLQDADGSALQVLDLGELLLRDDEMTELAGVGGDHAQRPAVLDVLDDAFDRREHEVQIALHQSTLYPCSAIRVASCSPVVFRMTRPVTF